MDVLQQITAAASGASTWHLAVLAYAVTVAVSDLRWRKIPRVITTAALVAGLFVHAVIGGFSGFGSSLVAALIGFGFAITFYRLGAIGGGDVKLVTALGAMLGISDWILAMEIAILAAATIAIGQALYHRRLRETVTNTFSLTRWMLTTAGREQHPVLHVANQAALRAPFGVAAAVGVLVSVMVRTWS